MTQREWFCFVTFRTIEISISPVASNLWRPAIPDSRPDGTAPCASFPRGTMGVGHRAFECVGRFPFAETTYAALWIRQLSDGSGTPSRRLWNHHVTFPQRLCPGQNKRCRSSHDDSIGPHSSKLARGLARASPPSTCVERPRRAPCGARGRPEARRCAVDAGWSRMHAGPRGPTGVSRPACLPRSGSHLPDRMPTGQPNDPGGDSTAAKRGPCPRASTAPSCFRPNRRPILQCRTAWGIACPAPANGCELSGNGHDGDVAERLKAAVC